VFEDVSDEEHEIRVALNELDHTILGQDDRDVVELLKRILSYAKRVSLI